ncbi:MAG: hypothetical protein HOY71_49840, partial [Nonomuraea sp.]|nr:hypothetical protein [Nonomuraea sp.]
MNRLPHAGLTGRRLLGFALRGGRRHVAVTTGAGLIAAVLNFATPVGALLLIGALTTGRDDLAAWYAAALLAAVLLTTLLGVARDRAATRTQSHMQRTLEPALWDRLLSLDLAFFRRHPVRRLLRRAQGVGLLRGMLGSGGLDALLGALFTALALTLLAVLDPWLGLAALALSAVILAGLAWLAWRQQRHDQEVYESVDDVQALMYPALLGIDEVHAYGAEAVVFDRWQGAFERQKTADDAGLRYA